MSYPETKAVRATEAYSPFWAILSVFTTLILLQVSSMIGDFSQRSQLKAARSQLQPMMAQAMTINQTTDAVGRELVAMSSTSAEAVKIINEFKIQLNKPTVAGK